MIAWAPELAKGFNQPNILVMDVSGILIGTAGVYYVMSELAIRGFHAAATHGNAPNFDILVCTAEGEDALALQVKSSPYATRFRGKGPNRKAALLDFPFSFHAGKIRSERVLFAFVDFGVEAGCKPDIYFIPSDDTFDWCKSWIKDYEGKMVRWTRSLEDMAKYHNNWSYLNRYKDQKSAEAILAAPIQAKSTPVESEDAPNRFVDDGSTFSIQVTESSHEQS